MGIDTDHQLEPSIHDTSDNDGHRRTIPRPDEMRLGRNIAQRLGSFAATVVRLSARLPKDATGRHIALQLVRSATGAGANYEEARAAESRADFLHKAAVALKELREARYWVALVNQTGWVESDLSEALQQATELAAILGASVRTARGRLDSGSPSVRRRE
jgi:four helix bundle protein